MTLLVTLLLSLSVFITGDFNHNGQAEGIGPNHAVFLSEGSTGELIQSDFTDQFSYARFEVVAGVYVVRTYHESTRPFFYWKCEASYFVGQNRTVELECQEFFFLAMPHVLAPFFQE